MTIVKLITMKKGQEFIRIYLPAILFILFHPNGIMILFLRDRAQSGYFLHARRALNSRNWST